MWGGEERVECVFLEYLLSFPECPGGGKMKYCEIIKIKQRKTYFHVVRVSGYFENVRTDFEVKTNWYQTGPSADEILPPIKAEPVLLI